MYFTGEYISPSCNITVDGCGYDFYLGRNTFSQPVLVDLASQDCGSLPIWIPIVIAIGIILGIILIGLIILCILKIAFVAWVSPMVAIYVLHK